MRIQAEYIGEVFLHVGKLDTEEEKIKYLRSVANNPLLQIFKFAYSDNFTTDYTQIPEYESDDSPIGYSLTGLHVEYKRIPYFLNTSMKIENKTLRDKKLRNILEVIHWTETPILEAIILKKQLPHISKDLVNKAFPELLGEDNGQKL